MVTQLFGSSNPYAYFPSGGLAWTFSNEEFFQPYSHIMSTGKLRVSFGKNGNVRCLILMKLLPTFILVVERCRGYLTSSGDLYLLRYLMAQRMENPRLQWEKTQSWNFALDFGFLNDRITGTLEYYRMSTKDMIMTQRLTKLYWF